MLQHRDIFGQLDQLGQLFSWQGSKDLEQCV